MMKRGHDVESAPSIWRRRTAMEHYAGIDVSLELSSVCVVDAQGKIVREAKVTSEQRRIIRIRLRAIDALGYWPALPRPPQLGVLRITGTSLPIGQMP